MNKYIGFLRAVNVGGNNILKMSHLKSALQQKGLVGVKTYIQSGNLAFSANLNSEEVRSTVEETLHKQFNLDIRCFVLTREEAQQLFSIQPFTENEHTSEYVILISRELNESEKVLIKQLAQNDEKFYFAKNALFISYPSGYGKSKVHAGNIEKKIGIKATARNMKTFLTTIEMTNEDKK